MTTAEQHWATNPTDGDTITDDPAALAACTCDTDPAGCPA
jgi:hypothetical protein